LEDLGADEIRILGKMVGKVWIGYTWLWTRATGEAFVNMVMNLRVP
jgi:hypothetical protein